MHFASFLIVLGGEFCTSPLFGTSPGVANVINTAAGGRVGAFGSIWVHLGAFGEFGTSPGVDNVKNTAAGGRVGAFGSIWVYLGAFW